MGGLFFYFRRMEIPNSLEYNFGQFFEKIKLLYNEQGQQDIKKAWEFALDRKSVV